MATTNEDLARLIISLEVTSKQMYNEFKKAERQTSQTASRMEKRLTEMSTRIDRTFANLGQRLRHNLTAPLAGVGAALSTREIIQYADAWTEGANRVAAAGSIVGLQGRNLEGIRQIADDSRAGFQQTVELYSRLLRSAGAVADSELEIARATELVTQAFKAGGAATSEMNAGILQLGQGLSSGFLQGDELRSVRENAPVLVQVMAEYFNTTIGGLKELGAQGELTSDRVFRAILSGEERIRSAFGTTRRTIGDGFRLIENALIQYIGQADSANGVTAQLTGALTAFADNFDNIADVVVKVAAAIAGVLVGRGLFALTAGLGTSIASLKTFLDTLRAVRTAGASWGTVGTAALGLGPIVGILGGGALLAAQHFGSELNRVNGIISSSVEEMRELGIVSQGTFRNMIDGANEFSEAFANSEQIRRARDLREALDFISGFGNIASQATFPFRGNEDLQNIQEVINRARDAFRNFGAENIDLVARTRIVEFAEQVRNGTGNLAQIRSELEQIASTPVDRETVKLLESFDRILEQAQSLQSELILIDPRESVQVQNALRDINNEINNMRVAAQEFTLYDEGLASDLSELDNQLREIYDRLRDNEISADEAKEAIAAINTDTRFDSLIQNLLGVVDNLNLATAEAIVLHSVLKSIENIDLRKDWDEMTEGFRQESVDLILGGDAYIAEQNRLLGMTREQRDLENEIARVRSEASQLGLITEEEILDLAQRRLAWEEENRRSRGSDADEKARERFFESLTTLERSNELLREEAELIASLNPLAEDYERTLIAWRKEQELINEAMSVGIVITPTLAARIRELAEAHADGTIAVQEAGEAQDKLIEKMQEWSDLAKSAMRSFIDDLIEGKSATDALANALSQLGNYLINLGLDTIFGGQGNPFGIFGGLFPGKEHGGAVKRGQPYVVGERRPELFVPNQDGVIIPRINSGNSGSGQMVSAPVTIQIDATGADTATLNRVILEVTRLERNLPFLIREQVSNRSKKGW